MTLRTALQEGEAIFWLITKDHIDGTAQGTANAPQEKLDLYKDLLTDKFKIYDDDGELYYEGLATNQSFENAFEPLDWAKMNAGCTDIQYYADGKWSSL